jgi:ComF family protein
LSSIAPPEHQRCLVCGNPAILGLTHPSCKNRYSPDQLFTAFSYKSPALAEAIITGKYYFIRDVFVVLGKKLGMRTRTALPHLAGVTDNIITPLPLHPRRKRWRGFNQADILAEEISKMLTIEKVHTLTRTRYKKTQNNLKRLQRIENMKGSFGVINVSAIQGKTVIVVDDVTTTGSTLLEAGKTLKRAGAKEVLCLALAED